MIEHNINEYLLDLGCSDPVKELMFFKLLESAQTEIEHLRKAETAISQLESLKYYDSWIKLADSWIELPETDFKIFLNNFMEANDPEKPAPFLY